MVLKAELLATDSNGVQCYWHRLMHRSVWFPGRRGQKPSRSGTLGHVRRIFTAMDVRSFVPLLLTDAVSAYQANIRCEHITNRAICFRVNEICESELFLGHVQDDFRFGSFGRRSAETRTGHCGQSLDIGRRRERHEDSH